MPLLMHCIKHLKSHAMFLKMGEGTKEATFEKMKARNKQRQKEYLALHSKIDKSKDKVSMDH